MSPRKQTDIAQNAANFMVYREGCSVKWECTVAELAEATKRDEDDVRRLCARRKWPVLKDEIPDSDEFVQ